MHAPFAICWIEPANQTLLDNIAEGVFDGPIRQDYLQAYLANRYNWLAVALIENLVVGQCMATVLQTPDKGSEIFLNEIGTGDDWRRRGIARALLRSLFARADAAGIGEIWLGTEIDNLPARALYENHAATEEAAVIYYLDW